MPLWPLLLYFVAAGLLAWGAHRLCPPFGRREACWLIVAPLVFVGPALVTGRTLSPIDRAYGVQPLSAHRELLAERPSSAAIFHDPFAQILPWRAATRHAFRLGEWPLWNPFSRAGEPLAGAGQAAPYSPINLLALLVPLADEAAFAGALTLAVAGLAAFLALTQLGATPAGALVGALGWATSSFLLFWVQWPLAQTVALFPLVLGAALRLARRADLGNAALLVLALAWILLTGHHESVAHVLFVAAAWAAAELPWSDWRRVARAICAAAVAGAVALALTAFFVLPHLDTIEQSIDYRMRRDAPNKNFHGRPLDEVTAALRTELVPFAWGVTNDERGAAAEFLSMPQRAFGGGLLLALAACGLSSRRRLALVGGALYLLGALAGAGFDPIHRLLARLPILNLALNSRLVFVGAFGLSLLAALGVDAWLGSTLARRRRLATVAAAAAALLALCALLFWSNAERIGLSGARYAARTVWLLAPAALVPLVLRGRGDARWAIPLLLLVHLAERRAETSFLYQPQERAAFMPLVAPLDSIPAENEPFRIVGFAFALVPNMSTYYGLEDLRSDNSLTLARLHDLQRARDPELQGWGPAVEPFSSPRDPIIDLLGARYVLIPSRRDAPRWYRPIARGRNLNLFRNRRALPRAFLPETLMVGSVSEPLLTELARIQSFSAVATIEPLDSGAPSRPERRPNGRGTVSTTADGLGFRLTCDLAEPAWIVVSESHWRGWRATSGGRALPLAYADQAYVGILAPAGSSEIKLQFRPVSFTWGLRLSAATALALAALAAALRFRRGAVSSGTTGPAASGSGP